MQELRLDVWKFVRLMVGMEEYLGGAERGKGSAVKRLYDKWEDMWVDLDAQLVDLGKHDLDAFSDLMMDQEVVLEAVTDSERDIVATQFERVLRQIKAQLSKTDDAGEVEDLSFERDELVMTIRDLQPKKRKT